MATRDAHIRDGVRHGGRRWCARVAVCALGALAAFAPVFAQAPPSAGPEEEKTAALEVVGRYRFGDPAPAAIDVRWASKSSIFVLDARRGVVEHELEEGLPPAREVLPGGDQVKGIRRLVSMGASGQRVAAASSTRTMLWNAEGGGAPGRTFEIHSGQPGSVADIDLDGDTLALLGWAPLEEGTEIEPDAPVWIGSLARGLEGMRPLLRDSKAVPGSDDLARMGFAIHSDAGSLRFTPEGDLLVFVGHRPVLQRVTSAGKVKAEWDLIAAGVFGGASLFAEGMYESTSGHEGHTAWMGKGTIVDDIVVFGKSTPGLLVRKPAEGKIQRRLAVLEGEAVTWYSLPVGTSAERVRLRADAAKNGDLVVLVTDRAAGAVEAEKHPDLEVLVLRQP